MQSITLDISKPADQNGKLTIRAEDIRYWHELRIINTTQLIYFGLKIWYPVVAATVDVAEFCEAFEISETDFNKAIADLTKKGGLHLQKPERYMQLNLFQKQETDQLC